MTDRVIKDKRGRVIEQFDILKVFHFASRRKKYYMYKMAVLWEGKLYASHLNRAVISHDFPLWTLKESDMVDYEIVQSKNFNKMDSRRWSTPPRPEANT